MSDTSRGVRTGEARRGAGGDWRGVWSPLSQPAGFAAVALFLGALAAAAWFGLDRLEHQERRSVGAALDAVVRTARAATAAWVDAESEHARHHAADPVIVDLAERLLAGPRAPGALLASPAQGRLQEALVAQPGSPGGFYLLDADLVTIASTTESEIGDRSRVAELYPEILARAFSGETVFVPPVPIAKPPDEVAGSRRTAGPTVSIAAPLRNPSGATIALLGLRYDVRATLERFLVGGRQGETGETYAFDRTGLLLSESRFTEELIQEGLVTEGELAAFNLRLRDPGADLASGERPSAPRGDLPLTRMARAATQGRSGMDVSGYRDYRGRRVLGAWLWDHALGIGFASEIDESEALADYRRNRDLVALALAIVVSFSLALVGWVVGVGRRINADLRRARDEWEQVARDRTAHLRQSEAQYRSLFEGSRDAVILFRGGRLLDCNPAALQVFGYDSREELCALPADRLSPPHQPDGRPSADCFEEQVAEALRHKSAPFELVCRRRDGSDFHAEVQLGPAEVGEQPATQAVIRDVSVRKGAQEQAQRQADLLERANESLDAARRAALSMMQDANAERERTRAAFEKLAHSQIALTRQREQLQAILDAAPSAVAIARGDELRYVNSKFVEMYGLEIGDDPGPCFTNPGSREWILGEIAAGRPIDGQQVESVGVGGKVLELLGSYREIEYQGEPSLLAWLVDVKSLKETERRLKQTSERLRLATSAAKIGIWEWTFGDDLVVLDEISRRLFGMAPGTSAVPIEECRARVHPEDLERLTEVMRGGRWGEGEIEGVYRVIWPDGSIHHIEGSGVVQHDEAGEPVRMVGTTWEVTEAKQAEEALRSAKEVAEAATRAKSIFLANMSHEIRTPMNAILGYAQLLQRDSSLGEQQSYQLAVIHRSGLYLLDLINDILEMSKIEAGRTRLVAEPFDLRNLLQDVELMFRELVRSRGVELIVELDPCLPSSLEGDAGKVRQVLVNLLSNAAKFTEQGRIRVRAAGRRVAGERVEVAIEVEDTGCGIDPASHDRIFDAFDQSDWGTRHGGTGLGLAISRSFARMMQGDVTLRSTVGEGSVFTFSFEAGSTSGMPVSEREPTSVPVRLVETEKPPRVLIVDDELTNRQLLEDLLTRTGFLTRVATSGEDALAEHAAWRPDLVLMDLRMPGIGGLEAIRRLRAADTAVSIIAITASVISDEEESAREAGADDFVRKPYRESALLARIGDALGVRYVYEASRYDAASERLADEASAATLSRLAGELPEDLVGELREAALQARAKHIDELASRVAEHSPQAAQQIRALTGSFRWEDLLYALEPGAPP